MSAPQTFSHFPACPSPVRVSLVTVADHACAYLPGRSTRTRMMLVGHMPPELYHQFMDAGFRRSGQLIYQPVCDGCRACMPIRVPVDSFQASKSQRRCWRRNADLTVSIDKPQPTDEKFALYCRYLHDRHDRTESAASSHSREDFESFLYESPLESTVEFTYRDGNGMLLAVGICDISPGLSLSSVYCYFDPQSSHRGLGTYAALREIEFAKSRQIPFYYLGFWIEGCSSMNYKSSFAPNEVLHSDGAWRVHSKIVTCDVPCNSINPHQGIGESIAGLGRSIREAGSATVG